MKIYNRIKGNKRVAIWFATFALVLSFGNASAQQDPMFTQYMFNTQTINPGYVGSWESIGFLALTRQQWTGIDGGPKTYTFSLQMPVKNEKIALGLNVITDKIGFEKKLSLFADYSYQVKLSTKTSLRLGAKFGFTNYSNSLSGYTLYDETDPAFAGGDINTKFMPNFGVGLFLHNRKYYLGLSTPKVINNKFDNNFNNYSTYSELRHFFLIGGYVFTLTDYLKFKPTFLAKGVKNAPLEVDLSANFLLKEKLWLGAMYRTGDAIGFIAQWAFDNSLRVGYAIDFTTTNLRHHHNGTHEIMVSFEIDNLKKLITSPRYF